MKYRREIDGLRALAVLPVIFFHAGFSTFSGGFVGVDIFFVISGYLIASIIIAELQSEKFSIINFYERRARRLLPALFTVLFTCLPLAWFFTLPSATKDFSESLIAVTFFVSNIYFWLTSGYFETAAELKPLLHTWSLAVEEQYYLIFPLFLALTWKIGQRKILAILVSVFIISLITCELIVGSKPAAVFFLLPTRIWELLLGVFAAFYLNQVQLKNLKPQLAELLSFAGLVLIAWAIFTFDKNTPFPSSYALLPTLGTFLIIIFSSGTKTAAVLGNRFLVGIGLISYSAYLWHQALFAFTRLNIVEDLPASFSFYLITICLVLAYFSWKYIETPFRDKQRFNQKQIFIFSFSGSIFFILIGIAGILTKGFEQRYAPLEIHKGDINHLEFHKYIAENYYECLPKNIAKEALLWDIYIRCMQSKNDSNHEIAIVGDSHAEHLFIGLAEAFPNKNIVFYIGETPPVVSNEKYKEIFDYVTNKKSIKTIIFTMQWRVRLGQIKATSDPQEEIEKTLDFLKNSNKEVLVLDNVPIFPFSAYRCKYLLKNFSTTKCEIEESAIEKFQSTYKETLNKALKNYPGIKFTTLKDLFCHKNICSMVKNGTIMYRDPEHLNIPGSQYVGTELAKMITE